MTENNSKSNLNHDILETNDSVYMYDSDSELLQESGEKISPSSSIGSGGKSNIKSIDKYDIGIFIFRRDLRIEDNRGLAKLSEKCKHIIPIFVFDPYQTDINSRTKNYLSFPVLRFICESLKELDKSIRKFGSKLYIFYGKPTNALLYIINSLKKSKTYSKLTMCIGFNEDFSKYSIERDNFIKQTMEKNNVPLLTNDDDFTLCSMDLLVKEDKTPYKQYGAFKKNMFSLKSKFNKSMYKKINFLNKELKFTKAIDIANIDLFWNENIHSEYSPVEHGGRTNGKKILSNLKNFKDYNENRDILSYNTTRLSAHLNFGTVSEREFYEELISSLGNSTQLINQIIWRNYFLTLARFLPVANSYDSHIDPRFNKLKWLDNYTGPNTKYKSKRNQQAYKEWEIMMNSKTGFLIIDAAIQEIKTTGFMHNRCRMMVGTFSVKYLQINPLCRFVGLNDWFSRYLVDCIVSQNKLNCQWVSELDFAGKKFAPHTAVIAGRPMNISNTMIKKWDNSCSYIKKWLPHLANVDNKILFNWDTKFDEKIHPGPIFDSKKRYQEWIQLCKN
jgi:deoxyribodipyrimidine photo-lyase